MSGESVAVPMTVSRKVDYVADSKSVGGRFESFTAHHFGGTLQSAHTLDSATQRSRSLLRTFGRVSVLL